MSLNKEYFVQLKNWSYVDLYRHAREWKESKELCVKGSLMDYLADSILSIIFREVDERFPEKVQEWVKSFG